MTTTLERSYQPLQTYEVEGPDETPHEIHVVPEGSKSRWNHVEDLDSFFTRMYQYHQKNGFLCITLKEAFALFQFVFVVILTTYLMHCVDYPVLFRDKALNKTKVSLSDALLPMDECTDQISVLSWLCLWVAFIFWCLRFIRGLLHLGQFWEIKHFFESALKVTDKDLENLTWHEVQQKVRDVQKEQQMCIHKQDLSELDIYHRILRFKNYMIAMVNKSLLPVKLKVPFVGEVIFMSQGLKYNLELLLFSGPWAPFENNWHLKEDYKKQGKRKELAENLSRCILWVGVFNFCLSPVILFWQILYSFFNYAELIKRDPGTLGSRCWSLYGRLYLRHFNELDHELHARLTRAYRPAAKYMDSFVSPLLTIIAENIGFVAGSIVAVFVVLTVYDEDVITIEHVLTIVSVCGVVYAICRASIPDQNMVWCPEKLMTTVLAHVHYLPDTWRGQAHTNIVRQEFAQLFQLRAVNLLEELLSPIITPYVLCFHLRHKALDIVDFYRNFTVEVVGVGDVCSFAQMDVRKHGNATWQTSVHSGDGGPPTDANQYTQAEDGKTELSLVHFTLTNPEWQPPTDAETFVLALRQHAIKDAAAGTAGGQMHNPLLASINSVSSLGTGYSSVLSSVLHQPSLMMRSEIMGGPLTPMERPPQFIRGGINRSEGPLNGSERGLLYSLTQCGPTLGNSMFGPETPMMPEEPPPELAAADMSLSTLYMHELHQRQMRRRVGGFLETSNRSLWQRPHQDMPGISEIPDEQRSAERTPLLRPRTNPFTEDS
ncbi:autophagy-related protein 9A [Neocloeon triangulifer]|uniref:autophagy-related protein 9A n=1 Tax=Neocloeon triangulifer TaxID=2078957 RepID=UPI00286EC49A|nr:autophagy-related protein 9A [Neocloeon triangulifer]